MPYLILKTIFNINRIIFMIEIGVKNLFEILLP
jgi:hypothetical protein